MMLYELGYGLTADIVWDIHSIDTSTESVPTYVPFASFIGLQYEAITSVE
jgi:hypothetical protein